MKMATYIFAEHLKKYDLSPTILSSITGIEIDDEGSALTLYRENEKPIIIKDDVLAVDLAQQYLDRESIIRDIWSAEYIRSGSKIEDVRRQLEDKDLRELHSIHSRYQAAVGYNNGTISPIIEDKIRTLYPDIPVNLLDETIHKGLLSLSEILESPELVQELLENEFIMYDNQFRDMEQMELTITPIEGIDIRNKAQLRELMQEIQKGKYDPRIEKLDYDIETF